MIRILILAGLFLFPTFAFGEEGKVMHNVRIQLTDNFYINTKAKLDIEEMILSGNTVEDSVVTIITIIYTF